MLLENLPVDSNIGPAVEDAGAGDDGPKRTNYAEIITSILYH